MKTRSSTVAALVVALLAVPMAASALSAAVDPSTLVEIRASHHSGFDRIVFEFEGPLPERLSARWVDRIIDDASGQPVPVQGNAFIRVVMSAASGHEEVEPFANTYGPSRRAFDLPNIAHVVNAGDFEAVLTFGIGLMKRTEILHTSRLQSPSRFVIDISTAFKQERMDIFLADQAGGAAVPAADVRPVARTVPESGRGYSLLLRLFAGPTVEEKAAGLRFVSSKAKGFRDLTINALGVARVTLKGGCDGGGSAITVASLIKPTLRQLPRVDWVKIYDRAGHTTKPWGARDSIPACLEP